MNKRQCEARYGAHVSERTVRRVWALVSREPQITTRTLARRLGYGSTAGMSVALRVLKDAGYIDFPPDTERARTILVPFIAIKERR